MISGGGNDLFDYPSFLRRVRGKGTCNMTLQRLANLDSSSKRASPPLSTDARRNRYSGGRGDVCARAGAEHSSHSELGSPQRAGDRDGRSARARPLRVMPKTRRLLKQGGRTFSNAFATTPMCCPSRASIFTGRYAHNHGIHVSVPKNPGFDHRSTLQHQLQKSSYQTGRGRPHGQTRANKAGLH